MYQKIRPKLFPKFNCQTWLLVLLLLFASRVPYFCLSWILVILRLPEIIGSIEKTKSLIWNLLAKCFPLKNLSWLAVDWIFVSTERLTCWNPNLNVLGGGALGKWFGHEDGALVSGICAPIKEATESSLASSTMRGHDEEAAVCKSGSRLSPETKAAGNLVLDLPVSRSMGNKFWFYVCHPVCGILF